MMKFNFFKSLTPVQNYILTKSVTLGVPGVTLISSILGAAVGSNKYSGDAAHYAAKHACELEWDKILASHDAQKCAADCLKICKEALDILNQSYTSYVLWYGLGGLGFSLTVLAIYAGKVYYDNSHSEEQTNLVTATP